MKRRDVLQLSTAIATGLVLPSITSCSSVVAENPSAPPAPPAAPGPFTLPPLPYAKEALAPAISAETLDCHHDKHHQAYVNNLNKPVAGKPDASKSLEEIILASDGPLFNNAAQDWNHSFYWKSMKPAGGGEPTGALAEAIATAFGSFAKFRTEFLTAATSQFGSGWAWLVVDQGKLAVAKTSNADLPLKHAQTPLLTCDVWEHAYYIDYHNLRAKYVEAFVDKLIDWDFAAANFAKAIAH